MASPRRSSPLAGLALVGLALFLAHACGGSSAKQTGTEKGPCFSDKTCKTGLVCLSDTCVKPDGAGGSGGSSAGTTGSVGGDGGAPATGGTGGTPATGGTGGTPATGGTGGAGGSAGSTAGAGGHAGVGGTGGTTDAGAPDSSATDAPIEVASDAHADGPVTTGPGMCSGVCNTLTQLGVAVSRTVSAAAVPTMTGGTPTDGTYVVTAVVQYNNDNTAYSLKETAVLSGSTDTYVASINGAADLHITATLTFPGASQLHIVACCPGVSVADSTYSATATTLTVIDPGNLNRVLTLTKQ